MKERPPRRIISAVIGDRSEEQPTVLRRADHPISRKNIDHTAIKVLYRLHRSGKKAYLVGGGVRDLMLEGRPKDFDVSTDARPNEVRRLFRNSRIIGRRFRLVHVFFKDGLVEVSTFRRDPDRDAQRGGPEDLLITDDNVFGTPREDAFRRDFTVNALFYNVADFTVIDYVDGIEDLRARLIRAIGDPDVRFQEDPVRMLRACELAARLGFGIEMRTQQAAQRNHRELDKAAPARLTEELLQILRCGSSGAAMQWMLDLNLLETLLPEVDSTLSAADARLGELGGIFPAIDRLVAGGREFSDATLLGLLVLPQILLERFEREEQRGRPMEQGQLHKLVQRVFGPFADRFVLSRQRRDHTIHALNGFFHIADPTLPEGKRPAFARKPFFEDAFGLFHVLIEATGQGVELLEPWLDVRRHRPPASQRRKPRPRRGRRRRGRGRGRPRA